ncbi:MAG: DUF3808 domain-containing protein [Ignavibacteriae bacterium]|nr:DUF3808 domain-containing protein [Ignavibacteriota bacterium]
MKKKDQTSLSNKKINKVKIIVLGILLIAVLLTIFVYPLFSNWRNSLYIPDLPDLSSQPKAIVEYVQKMHEAALENPSSDHAIGQLGMTFQANFFNKEAERCYNRAMNLNDREWIWPYYIAIINEEIGDVSITISNLEKVVERNPNIAEAWYRLGNAYLKQNENKKALASFNEVLNKKPYNPSNDIIKFSNKGAFPLAAFATLNLCRTKYKLGKYDESLQELNKLIETYSTFGSAYRLKSQIYFTLKEIEKSANYELRAGDFDSFLPPADKIYDNLIIHSRKTDFIIKQMEIAIRTKNYKWAKELNKHIINYKPEDERDVFALLKLSVDLKHKEGMNAYGNIFSKMFQNNEPKLLEMARHLISKKEFDLAKPIIQWVIKKNPTSVGAHLEYASLFRLNGHFQNAVDYCNNLIRYNPNNPYIQIELARNFTSQKKYNEAEKLFASVEKNDPNNVVVSLFQAKLFRERNNADKAIHYYLKYLKANPIDVVCNLELGNYYIDLKKWEKATTHFKALIDVSPNYLDYIERYAFILAACPNQQYRNGQKALEFGERIEIMEKYDDDQVYRSELTIAASYAELNDFENAIMIVNENLLKLKSKNVDDYFNKFSKLKQLFQSRKPYRI